MYITRKRLSIDVDDLVSRYLAGEHGPDLARENGISRASVYNVLRRQGIQPRKKTEIDRGPKLLDGLEDHVLALYAAGSSGPEIASDLGVSNRTVYELLRSRQVVRSESEANKLGAFKVPIEVKRVRATRLAETSRVHSPERRAAQALTKQMRALEPGSAGRATADELLLWGWLRDRGLEMIPQLAVGPYNVDLGADAIAVEIFGGGWHAYGGHRARLLRRTKYVLDSGRAVQIVWVNPAHHPLTSRAADDIVAYAKQASSDPAARRQYRVIWGTGDLISCGDGYPEEIALIPTGARGDYRRS